MLGSSSYVQGDPHLGAIITWIPMGHVGKFYLEEFKMLPFRQTGEMINSVESPGYEIPFVQINRQKNLAFHLKNILKLRYSRYNR